MQQINCHASLVYFHPRPDIKAWDGDSASFDIFMAHILRLAVEIFFYLSVFISSRWSDRKGIHTMTNRVLCFYDAMYFTLVWRDGSLFCCENICVEGWIKPCIWTALGSGFFGWLINVWTSEGRYYICNVYSHCMAVERTITLFLILVRYFHINS